MILWRQYISLSNKTRYDRRRGCQKLSAILWRHLWTTPYQLNVRHHFLEVLILLRLAMITKVGWIKITIISFLYSCRLFWSHFYPSLITNEQGTYFWNFSIFGIRSQLSSSIFCFVVIPPLRLTSPIDCLRMISLEQYYSLAFKLDLEKGMFFGCLKIALDQQFDSRWYLKIV